jgi:hypothetical protein
MFLLVISFCIIVLIMEIPLVLLLNCDGLHLGVSQKLLIVWECLLFYGFVGESGSF